MFGTLELSRGGMARTGATSLTDKTLIKLDRMPHYVAALIPSLRLHTHTHSMPIQRTSSTSLPT